VSSVERGEGRVEGFRPAISTAADQLQAAAAVDDGDQPMAVVLDLVQPARAIGRRRAWRHDLQADGGGLARWRRALGQDKVRHIAEKIGATGGIYGARLVGTRALDALTARRSQYAS